MKQNPSSNPVVFTVDEFCTAHRISRAGFYKLKKRGNDGVPPVFHVGKRTLIDAEAARQWRAKQTEAAK
jgi:hypothetical protein